PIVALVLVIGVLVIFQFRPPKEEVIDPGLPKDVVAIVNGEQILTTDYDPYRGFWALAYGFSAEEMLEDEDFNNYLLETFIRERLQTRYLTDIGLSIDEDELEMELTYVLYDFFADDEEQAEFELEYGFSVDTIRQILLGYMLDDLYNRTLIEEVSSTFSDDQFLEVYLEYQDYFFNSDPGVSVSHILVETEEEALAALDRLAAGEDFADLAREISLDYSSAINGGKLSPFTVDANLVPEFIEASFALSEPGEISGLVPSFYGFHIIKLNAYYEADSYLDFTDAKEYLPYIVAEDIRNSQFEDLWYFADIDYAPVG
ncbi:MAG: peptidylprolyl isomerase, partial [Symbiobacteriaceae bacterium]|nr:peptidylprolyl isomerase [Symbiobacteriaceae bacterium]